MFDFGTSTEQVVNRYSTKSGTSIGALYKQYKQENKNSDFLKVENDKDYGIPL